MANKVKICRYCRSEIDKKAKICPHCRKRQGESCLSATIFVLLVLGFWCFIGYKIFNGSDSDISNYQSSERTVQSNDPYDNLTLSQKNALKAA